MLLLKRATPTFDMDFEIENHVHGCVHVASTNERNANSVVKQMLDAKIIHFELWLVHIVVRERESE